MLFKNNGGGFVVAEFAIALPLLIFLVYGLANVTVKIFELGKSQLADYVLETEAQYVMERITHIARVAKEVEIKYNSTQIKFVYHTTADKRANMYEAVMISDEVNGKHYVVLSNDVLETQYFILYTRNGRTAPNLYATRKSLEENHYPTNPITGDNYFGDTKVNYLRCDLDEQKKLLHISLELESLATGKKIKLNTAVFMSSYEPKGA